MLSRRERINVQVSSLSTAKVAEIGVNGGFFGYFVEDNLRLVTKVLVLR